MRREVLADIVAMVVFSMIVGFSVEMGVSGMTLVQSLRSRLTSIPANIVTARPYGIYRDWWGRIVSTKLQYHRSISDTVAFVTFQIPLYCIILALAGAEPRQIASSCVSVVFISFVSGRPFGILLDFVRSFFGVQTAQV